MTHVISVYLPHGLVGTLDTVVLRFKTLFHHDNSFIRRTGGKGLENVKRRKDIVALRATMNTKHIRIYSPQMFDIIYVPLFGKLIDLLTTQSQTHTETNVICNQKHQNAGQKHNI
jgi:hypothetical protein